MKARVNICSALLQGCSYAHSFFRQIEALSENGYELATINVTLDGEELTDPVLIEVQADPRVRFIFEGPRSAPTSFMQTRSIAWARTGNLALEGSLSTPSELTLWIESDLSFPCDLIELLMEPDQDIVAPVIMLGEHFYDAWGFRDLSGGRIDTLPGLQAIQRGREGLIELSSVGSCLLFRSSLLRQGARMPVGYESGLLVGFCREARELGARVFCRPDVVIVHPTSLWRQQVYRVATCRLGIPGDWRELAPAGGAIVAGPYFEFVIPEACRLLNGIPDVPRPTHLAYATNGRKEIAIVLGNHDVLPPVPDGFAAPSVAQQLPPSSRGAPKRKSNWLSRLLSR